MKERVCPMCGNLIPSRATGRPAKYCSEACRRQADNVRKSARRALAWSRAWAKEAARRHELRKRSAAYADQEAARLQERGAALLESIGDC